MPRRSGRGAKKKESNPSLPATKLSSKTKGGQGESGQAGDNGVSSRLRPRPQVTAPKGSKSPPSSKGKAGGSKSANGSKKMRNHHKMSKMGTSDPSVYVSPSGEEYRSGDFAYVDSQQPEQAYHVCLIKDFKQVRRDSMMAEIVWFFRVQEIPESTYLLLLEDRTTSRWPDVFAGTKVRQRELFIAHNRDSYHTSFFRGKCTVKVLDEIDDLAQYIAAKDTFFYDLGFSPESRQLTWLNEDHDAYIPYSHQAAVPDLCTLDKKEEDEEEDEEKEKEEEYEDKADCIWVPDSGVSDQNLLMYLRSARSIALHAGLWINGYLREGYMAASSDDTTQNAYDVLKKRGYDIGAALQELAKHPQTSKCLVQEKCWCSDDTTSFTRGVKQYGKNFHRIQTEHFPSKQVSELTQYYYHWKKTTVGLSSRAHRRQNKMRHIRLWKQMGRSPPTQQQEREMVDLSSCEEDDDEEYRDVRLYACRHCYSRESTSWHHSGPDRALLCRSCQLYFCKYGEMPTIEDRGSPPQVLYKDFHKALHLERLEGRRTTRNNAGPTEPKEPLATEKLYSESGSGEEESGSEEETSDDDSSVYTAGTDLVTKLQRRKSILTSIPVEREDEETGIPASKKSKSDTLKEEVKTEPLEDPGPSLLPPCKGAPLAAAATSGGTNPKNESKMVDPLQNTELQYLEPPPNFHRVGKWSSNGETAARTHFEYVHNENAKYIQQKKVSIRTNKEGSQLTPGIRTPSASAHRLDPPPGHSSFSFPSIPNSHAPSYPTSLVYPPEAAGVAVCRPDASRWGSDSLRQTTYTPSPAGQPHQMVAGRPSSKPVGGSQRGMTSTPLSAAAMSMPRPPFESAMAEVSSGNPELMQRPVMLVNNGMEYFPMQPTITSPMMGTFPGYALMGGIPQVAPDQFQYLYQLMAQQQMLGGQGGGQQDPTPIHKPVIVHST